MPGGGGGVASRGVPLSQSTERSRHTPPLHPPRPTPASVRTPPRFPPSRLFGRLPPCIPARLRPAGIRKPLTKAALPKPLCALSVVFSNRRILGQLNIFGSKGDARC